MPVVCNDRCPVTFRSCSSSTRLSASPSRCRGFPMVWTKVIDVLVVQFVQLLLWWSRRANCGFPQLQFSDMLVTCPLLSTTGLGGAADAVLALMDVAVNMQRHVVSRQSRCLRLSSSPEFVDISLRNRDRYAQLCLAFLVWPALVAAMRVVCCSFVAFFGPPSIWTLRPRVAGTPGV